MMEKLDEVVHGGKSPDNQTDSKKESTKPTVVKREKTEDKKPVESKEMMEVPVAVPEVFSTET
jgi:hypothetical protein